jgi:hypothetical protein
MAQSNARILKTGTDTDKENTTLAVAGKLFAVYCPGVGGKRYLPGV